MDKGENIASDILENLERNPKINITEKYFDIDNGKIKTIKINGEVKDVSNKKTKDWEVYKIVPLKVKKHYLVRFLYWLGYPFYYIFYNSWF